MSEDTYEEYSRGQLVSRIKCLEIDLVKANSTLRDEFAKVSAPALLAADLALPIEKTQGRTWVAQQAYLMADIMLVARK